jgi:hypothetical protein
MPRPLRQPTELRESRRERAKKMEKAKDPLGPVMTAIDIALGRLNYLIDRSERECRTEPSGSVVGSVIQVPQSNPSHEGHFDFLLTVKKTFEDLVQEAP